MTKRILLTGGAGFIGSHTYVALVSAGFDVVILDNFENSRRDVKNRLEKICGVPTKIIECDIRCNTDVERVFAETKYDAVVHFAALKSIPDGEADPVKYYQTNCIGLVNIVSAMQLHGIKTIVFSSSAAVYGSPSNVPIDEGTVADPENNYARTKVFGEKFLLSVAKSDPNFIVGILRYFNPVGAHESGLIGEDPSQPPSNLVPVIARLAKGQISELKIFGGDYPTPDGTGIRDYIHITDLANGHIASVKTLLDQKMGHLVNLGTGTGHSVLEVLKTYGEVSQKELLYNIVDRRPGDAAISFAVTDLAKDILNFETQYDLRAMCESNWKFACQNS